LDFYLLLCYCQTEVKFKSYIIMLINLSEIIDKCKKTNNINLLVELRKFYSDTANCCCLDQAIEHNNFVGVIDSALCDIFGCDGIVKS
jgi:hypothetical protein